MATYYGHGPRRKYNITELSNGIEKYFKHCDETGEIYTVSGICSYLKLGKSTWVKYRRDTEIPEYAELVAQAQSRIEAQMEQRALLNQSNSSFTMFIFKNNFGYKDKIEQTIEQTSTVTLSLADEIEQAKEFFDEEKD